MKPLKYSPVVKWSLLSLGGVLILLVSGSYLFGRISEEGIMFTASTEAASQTVGLPFDIHLIANNDSDNLLKNVSVSILLPNGAIFASGDDRKISSIAIGDLHPGEIKEKIVSVIILPAVSLSNPPAVSLSNPPADRPEREFLATLYYKLERLSASFEKETTLEVIVEDFPLSLEITSPETISPGQDFELKANYENISEKILPGVKIVLDYPDTFELTSAVPKPDANDHWSVEGLSAGKGGEITITGNVDLQENSVFEAAFRVILNLGGLSYDVLRKPVAIMVEPSPISVGIVLDGEALAYRPGETMNYVLSYRNNSDEPYDDAVIKVKLIGEMYNLGSLEVEDAAFSTVTRTITWSHDKLRELRSIAPGNGGDLEFSIDVKESFSIKRINDRNFTVKADARIESSKASNSAIGLSSAESKIAGALLIESAGYFRDAPSLILNSGPWPPVAGVPTEFTIHWRVGSYSTDVSDVEVRARLGEGVMVTGKGKSSIGDKPAIDTETGEVTWRVGKLLATSGILSDMPEAIFQVRATPTDSMIGDYMTLLSETSITATDDFSTLEIESSAEPVTTRLESDSSVRTGEGRVIN